MKTLLFLILFFIMFGWLGIMALGLGGLVLLGWAVNNWGIVLLVVLAMIFGPAFRRWNETRPNDVLDLREEDIIK